MKNQKCSGRKALQPRNIFLTPEETLLKPKARIAEQEDVEKKKTIDASLAEELKAFKKKLQRLREDLERTEKLLEERDGAMELHMKHLLQRGEAQKCLELQVDRLFRLKELHAYSSNSSPFPSLRVKEQEKRKRLSFEPMVAVEPEEEDEEEESSVKTEAIPRPL